MACNYAYIISAPVMSNKYQRNSEKAMAAEEQYPKMSNDWLGFIKAKTGKLTQKWFRI